jgi:hypothetical protein
VDEEEAETPPDVEYQNFLKFKYVPVTSADVERSFSGSKLVLVEKRHNCESENTENILVIYCAAYY